MKKIGKINELAWVLGIIFCSLGVCLCTKANFGLSMIAAPPYIIHLKMVQLFPWYSQGTSEYIWQGILLVIMCLIIRRFKFRYLLSFAAAVIFGIAVDAWLRIFGGNAAYENMAVRIIAFLLGESVTALAIAFYFRTDMPLQMYELIVVEIAAKFGLDKNKAKLGNDIIMLALSVILALGLNHSFKGIGVGTIVITAVNAKLIAIFGNVLDRFFTFEPRFEKFTKAINA